LRKSSIKVIGFTVIALVTGISLWYAAPVNSKEKPAEEASQAPPPEVILPRQDFDTYLGIWMPALYHLDIHSLQDAQDLNRIGANTAAFAMELAYNDEGYFHERRVDVARSRARHYTKLYKKSGLAVMIAPEPVEAKAQGKPGRIPLDIREAVLKNYEAEIIEFAEMAEKENVEIFSPMNEPDFKLGHKLASSWGQEILPKIRKVYSGKILWKGSLGKVFESYKRIDFKGYDIVGMTSYPLPDADWYREKIATQISILTRQAKEDGVPETFISEFGAIAKNRLQTKKRPSPLFLNWGATKSMASSSLILPKDLEHPSKDPNSKTS